MKIKFKSGNTKIKFTCEGIFNSSQKDSPLEAILNKYEDENCSFKTRLSKSDLDFFKEVCEKIPSNIISYYENVNKSFEKYVKMNMNVNKSSCGNEKTNSDILPVNGHDIYNYTARYGIANFQIQAIMKLNGKLDFDKLVEAVRLSVIEEPVFGCHFIENEPPYWKRPDNIDTVKFCSLEETGNLDEAVQRFLESPLDMDNDPMVKVKLIRSDSYDTLALKINHSCCDGTGAKEYIQLLSDIYTSITQENGVFEPKPSIRTREDQDKLFTELGIQDPETAWKPGSDILLPTWSFPWRQEKKDITHYVVCRLPFEQLNEMTDFAKAKGAKINDLFLTAFCRAMHKIGEPIFGVPMEMAITVDLRRFIPECKTKAIRNFSGSENLRVPMVADESFNDNLSRVMLAMAEIKKNFPGLQSAIGLERIEKICFHDALAYFKGIPVCPSSYGNKCMPSLSNLGFLTKNLLKFGEYIVTDAYIVPPVVNAPGLLLMLSTYNDIITLAAGYYEATVEKSDIEKLLNEIQEQLKEGCKQ